MILIFVILVSDLSVFFPYDGNLQALPRPRLNSINTFEESLSGSALPKSGGLYDIRDISDLLWSAQGVTDSILKFRAIPSPGATYPLEVIIIIGEGTVIDLPSGVYHYAAEKHALELLTRGDYRSEVLKFVLGAEDRKGVESAPFVFVVTAVYERTIRKYGDRGPRYVELEVGCLAQSLTLESRTFGLKINAVLEFDRDGLKKMLGSSDPVLILVPKNADVSLPATTTDLLLLPVDFFGVTPLNVVISRRRTIRDFGSGVVNLDEVSQIIWAADGVTSRSPERRTVQPIGGLDLLEVYVAVRDVKGLEPGLYRYDSTRHVLAKSPGEDVTAKLYKAAFENQYWILDAKFSIIILANSTMASERFPDLHDTVEWIQCGMSALNINLQATSLGLASGVVGAFDDKLLLSALGLGAGLQPLFIVNVGNYKEGL